jgi:uncharacterized protein YukE
MSGLADPGELDRAANQLERHARALRGTKHAIAGPAAATSWQGIAAEGFRTWVSDDASTTESASGQLEAIARALRAAATELRAKIAAQQKQARAQGPSASA